MKGLLRVFASLLAMALTFAAHADELSMVSNPENLGFSSARLARITSWFQERGWILENFPAQSWRSPETGGSLISRRSDFRTVASKSL